MIPKESDGERFEDALARVRRCIGGGGATDNADSDSDLEVVADFFTVNLRCPVSNAVCEKQPCIIFIYSNMLSNQAMHCPKGNITHLSYVIFSSYCTPSSINS